MKCPKCQAENPDTQRFCGNCATPLPSFGEFSSSQTETVQTPVRELTTGTTFAGRYQIIEELGHGGMGRAYKVLDTDIKEKIALKLLRPEIALDKETVERFSNELKLARKISHRNVCRMFDLGKAEGTTFITMEFVPGEDLKKLIRKMGQVGAARAVSIAKQVCEGLAEAHHLGVIHRDLKPQNIMVDEDGNARIMDFGIARSLSGKGITEAGVMIGTPEYMSPEQAEGKEVDQRSDIYSLGVILYEMMAGRPPFEGDTPLAVVYKHKNDIPSDPRKWNPQIPRSLVKLILKCLEKDPLKRYQTAEELILNLEGAQKADRGFEELPSLKMESSIGVLPFVDLSPDKDQEYFCDGLAEELINTLTKIKDLQVASRTSAFAFKGKDMDIRQVGERLRVNAILEGSVRKSGTRVRITAQLINIADGYHLWSERYDREMTDIFAIQEEIALAIADKFRPRLLIEEKAKLLKRPTKDVEAFNYYLRGRFFWNKRTEEDLKKGVENFERAIARDSRFALAYSGLSDCYNSLGYRNFIPRDEAFSRAGTAARKAIELDDSIGEAFVSLANVKFWMDWDLAAAEQDYKRALELNPSNGEAYHHYAHLLAIFGCEDESIQEMKKALEMEPFSIIINSCLGQNLYLARRYDEAIEQLQKTIEMDPHFYDPYDWLGLSYIKKGRYEQAIELLQKRTASEDVHPRTKAVLGHALAAAKQDHEASSIMAQLTRLTGAQTADPYHLAWVQAGFGDPEQSLNWLNKAYEARSIWFCYLKIDPLFDFLRSDPRFIKLMDKIGFNK
jgi:serine/threonine protein kinase/Tfp pilus assembly protein PilF